MLNDINAQVFRKTKLPCIFMLAIKALKHKMVFGIGRTRHWLKNGLAI